MNNLEFLYITGDLFVSEEDNVNFRKVIENHFNEGTVVFNLEGAPRALSGPRIKAVALAQNKSLLELGGVKNYYFSLVNNHISDFGKDAYEAVVLQLKDKGLVSISTDPDPRKKVGSTSFIFFADDREECRSADYSFLRFDRSVILKNKRFIKDSIVVVHGGLEYRRHPTPYQKILSHLLVDLGAKTVIFHHSHIQGVYEWYSGKFIHYGLGNFYFSKVAGLHGLADLDGSVIRISTVTGVVEIASVKYSESDDLRLPILNLNFRIAEKSNELPENDVYKNWYKKNYPIDSSLRPRQLYNIEFIIRSQFVVWHFFAAPLVKFGWSKKIKSLIKRVF